MQHFYTRVPHTIPTIYKKPVFCVVSISTTQALQKRLEKFAFYDIILVEKNKNKMFKHIIKYTVTFIVAFMSIVPSALAARFYVEDNPDLRKGCPGQIRVMMDTEGADVLSADATMNFDNTQMSVTSMSVGVALPMQTYNKITGTLLELSGARLPGTGAFNGNGLYGLLEVTPDIAADTINFEFSPDLTTDNLIAEDGTFNNIITAATGRTFDVKDRYNKEVDGVGYCNPDLTPPTVTFIQPSNGEGNVPVDQPNEIFSIADNRAGVDISTLEYTIEGVDYTETSSQTDTSEAAGVHRVETTFTEEWTEGQRVDISVYVCDLNTDPAPNCNTTNGHFNIYKTPPPKPVCGDGIVTYTNGEQCDDGNTEDGDGCSAHCFNEIEPVECPVCEDCPPCPGPTIITQTEYVDVAGPPVEEVDIMEGEYPEVAEDVKDGISGCTRADITQDLIDEFDIAKRYNIKDEKCLQDIEHCMLPFMIHSAYDNADPSNNRYYPDVYLEGEREEPLLEDDSGPVKPDVKKDIHFITRQADYTVFTLMKII
jgi:cysteine-rich repeat protein